MADVFFIYDPSGQREGAGTILRQWRIYYGDGTTFDSNDGSWEGAPSENVQLVILYEGENDNTIPPRPRRFIFSGDDYYFKDGEIFGSSFDDITKVRGSIKFGKFLSDDDFSRIRLKAEVDFNI